MFHCFLPLWIFLPFWISCFNYSHVYCFLVCPLSKAIFAFVFAFLPNSALLTIFCSLMLEFCYLLAENPENYL